MKSFCISNVSNYLCVFHILPLCFNVKKKKIIIIILLNETKDIENK